MRKELLFSLTKKDFKIQTFRAGGKGGQHQNKTNSGVRIIHINSNAIGESREERSQYKNKKIAFKRLVESKKFKAWHRVKCSEIISQKSINEIVDELMKPENLKVEIKNEKGQWVKEP